MKTNSFLRQVTRAGRKFGVYLMNNYSHDEVNLFLQSFYASFGYRPQFDKAFFDWFYLQNPLGECRNYILVDQETDRWIGAFGFGKKGYHLGGSEKLGALAVNGFINPGFEGRGLYTDLINTGMERENFSQRMAFSFPHSANIPSAKGHLKNGWKLFRKLIFFEKQVSNQLAEATPTSWDDLQRVDFARLRSAEAFALTRSRKEIKWRFADRPDKRYSLALVDDGEMHGYMVLGYYQTKMGTKRAQIADYRYTTPETLRLLGQKCEKLARHSSCQIIDVLINPFALEAAAFREMAFRPRDEGYDMLTFSKMAIELPLNSQITYGDFDVV